MLQWVVESSEKQMQITISLLHPFASPPLLNALYILPLCYPQNPTTLSIIQNEAILPMA